MKTPINQLNPSSISTKTSTVQQLYAKFQNLKQRITNTDNKRSSKSKDKCSINQSKFILNKYKNIDLIEPPKLNVCAIKNQPPKLSSKQNVSYEQYQQQHLKLLCEKVLHLIIEAEKKYTTLLTELQRKLSCLEAKLLIAQETINQSKIRSQIILKNNCINEKKQVFNFDQKKQNFSHETSCCTYESLSENTTEKCSLQTKINQKNIDLQNQFLSCKKLTQIEQLLFQKEKKTLELKTENKKLRKLIEDYKRDLQKNAQQNRKLRDESKRMILVVNELDCYKKHAEKQKQNFTIEIQKLKMQIRQKGAGIIEISERNKKLSEELNRVKVNKVYNDKNNYQDTHNQTKNSKDTGSSQTLQIKNSPIQKNTTRNSSNKHNHILITDCIQGASTQSKHQSILQSIEHSLQLETVLTDRSEVLDHVQQSHEQKQSAEIIDLQMLEIHQIQHLKHTQSQVYNRSKDGFIYVNERKQKCLVDEIRLLEEENKLLKEKKDKFQAEIFKAENDEDRMQQQLSRLNQQIRRINTQCYLLDQCAVKLFKGQELKQEKIVGIFQQSKLRQQFYKKKQSKKRGFSLRRS